MCNEGCGPQPEKLQVAVTGHLCVPPARPYCSVAERSGLGNEFPCELRHFHTLLGNTDLWKLLPLQFVMYFKKCVLHQQIKLIFKYF